MAAVTSPSDASAAAAAAAGLRLVSPERDRGLARHRAGRGFYYTDDAGARVRAPAQLARIRALAIPPAWRSVWICADPRGHIQAVGRDARGRLQYRYHDRWRVVRDADKYAKLAAFCRALPALRRRVARDLGCRCVCRETAAAAAVALLERGHLRVGNDEYTRHNGTYGATTLEGRHCRVHGARIRLRYVGKSNIERRIDVVDARLARVLRRVRALPGDRLFQYRDGDAVVPITSSDVNAYLRAQMGRAFSAKDFRTWAATLACALRLAASEPPTSVTAGKRVVSGVIREVADLLGHTPTVCRTSYVHPAIITAYLDGTLASAFPAAVRARAGRRATKLRPAERSLVRFLEATG